MPQFFNTQRTKKALDPKFGSATLIAWARPLLYTLPKGRALCHVIQSRDACPLATCKPYIVKKKSNFVLHVLNYSA